MTIVEEDIAAILRADLPWRDFDGRSVLISGAGGFLASWLVFTLGAMRETLGFGPARLLLQVRSRARAAVRLGGLLDRDDVILIEAPVEDAPAIDGPIDYIVHAASPASPRVYLTDPVGVMAANLDGARQLLELARARGARLLLFSSGEVYGGTDRVPTPEDDPGQVNPMAVRSCYAESKRAAETLVAAHVHQHGVHASVVRPFHTYGPGVALGDGRVFADFVADVVAGRDIVLRSDGRATRAFCYVADATEGFITVMLKGRAGLAYNIGNDAAEIAIGDLAQTLAGLFPERGLSVVRQARPAESDYAPSPIQRNVPDITRASALGWRPRTDIADGFSRMVRSYGIQGRA